MVRKLVDKSSRVDILISKGSPVKEDQIKETTKWTNINLRMPSEMLKEIDNVVKDRIGMSRNAWLLEAISDKIKNDNG